MQQSLCRRRKISLDKVIFGFFFLLCVRRRNFSSFSLKTFAVSAHIERERENVSSILELSRNDGIADLCVWMLLWLLALLRCVATAHFMAVRKDNLKIT